MTTPIWTSKDGQSHLYQAEAVGVMAQFDAGRVQALITDPPYSSGGQFRGDRMQRTSTKYIQWGSPLRPEFSGDNRDQRAYLAWSTVWLAEALRSATPGSPCCLFSDWRQLPTTSDAIQCGGWIYRGIVPWDKGGGVRPSPPGRFTSQAEFVVWGSAGPMVDQPTVGFLPGIYKHAVRAADKFHIAGKPSRLMRDIVKICPPGGTVLDPFAGSGSTGVAALEMGRHFIGVEIDDHHAKLAAGRLEEADARFELFDAAAPKTADQEELLP